MKAVAYLSPFTNTTNRYIDMQKQLLVACGYEVKPLSIKSLVLGRAWGIFNAKNLLLFHWLETRPFIWRGAHPSISLQGLIEYVIYILVMCVARARVIYFVHDHAVHDTQGWKKRFSIGLIAIGRMLADTRIVHDPSFTQAYRANYLPHPLYWDAPDAPGKAALSEQMKQATDSPLTFAMLGAIRPYKSIHEILSVWPATERLIIRGRGSVDYVQKLKDIINARGLTQSVDLQEGFLSDQDFSTVLDQIDVLILPHMTDSMLVSGAFFEAAGRVPFVLSRSSPFIDWVAQQIDGVFQFNTPAELRSAIQHVAQCKVDNKATAARRVEQMFGWQACVQAYAAVLAQH